MRVVYSVVDSHVVATPCDPDTTLEEAQAGDPTVVAISENVFPPAQLTSGVQAGLAEAFLLGTIYGVRIASKRMRW